MIRVLVVDDHALVRRGLTDLLASTDDLTVVGSIDDGSDAAAAVVRLEPDIVLITIPNAPRERLDAVVDACVQAGVNCRFVRREIDLDPHVVLGTTAE